MNNENITGRLDRIQPPTLGGVWDASNDRTEQTSAIEKYHKLQQAWQKNKFKPTTRMEYLMRRVRAYWRLMVFRLQVASNRWDKILHSEKAMVAICVVLIALCMIVGFLLGINFPD
ncbi:hypothetical protein K7A41_23405 [Sphingobacterium sp. InxBP1]|uniref:hypothetical protein n=1 Tax=Sphingobacterium sp. InxBP1 TaxID=2870328 RepID=UPI0022444B28|nr:hypothetical protein [Sphingobacterium sp. InxBP1]MCW8314193.1 hypothetical protein [Sphingobacterium sp. InxBP1]